MMGTIAARLCAVVGIAMAITGAQAFVTLHLMGSDKTCGGRTSLQQTLIASDMDTCYEVTNAKAKIVSEKHYIKGGYFTVAAYSASGCKGGGTLHRVPLNGNCTLYRGPPYKGTTQSVYVKATSNSVSINSIAPSLVTRTLAVVGSLSPTCVVNATVGVVVNEKFREGACTTVANLVAGNTLDVASVTAGDSVFSMKRATKTIISSGMLVTAEYTDLVCKTRALTALLMGMPLNKCLGPITADSETPAFYMKFSCDGGSGCTA